MNKYQILYFSSETLNYIEIDFIYRKNTTKEKVYEQLVVEEGYDPDIVIYQH